MTPRVLTSSKAHLALAAIVAVTLLAALDKLDGMAAGTMIMIAAGIYSGATAYEDRKRKPPTLPMLALLLVGCAGNMKAIDPYQEAWEREASSCARIVDEMAYAACRAAVDVRWARCFATFVESGSTEHCPEVNQ